MKAIGCDRVASQSRSWMNGSAGKLLRSGHPVPSYLRLARTASGSILTYVTCCPITML
jgi:hypothetical protein